MDIHCKFVHVDLKKVESTYEETVDSFLKTRQGLSYLCMRYPTLSLQQAIEEYKIKALQNEQYIQQYEKIRCRRTC